MRPHEHPIKPPCVAGRWDSNEQRYHAPSPYHQVVFVLQGGSAAAGTGALCCPEPPPPSPPVVILPWPWKPLPQHSQSGLRSASLPGCCAGWRGEERVPGYFQANMGLSLNYCFLSWKERKLVTRDICYQYTNNSRPITEWKIIAAEAEPRGSQEGLLQALAAAVLSRSRCQHFHYHPPGSGTAPGAARGAPARGHCYSGGFQIKRL